MGHDYSGDDWEWMKVQLQIPKASSSRRPYHSRGEVATDQYRVPELEVRLVVDE